MRVIVLEDNTNVSIETLTGWISPDIFYEEVLAVGCSDNDRGSSKKHRTWWLRSDPPGHFFYHCLFFQSNLLLSLLSLLRDKTRPATTGRLEAGDNPQV